VPADQCVVVLEDFPPLPVAELERSFGRADDVGEKHRREHSIHIDEIPFTALPDTAEKARDLPCDLLWIDEPRVVFPLQLDKLRFGIASAIARPSASRRRGRLAGGARGSGSGSRRGRGSRRFLRSSAADPRRRGDSRSSVRTAATNDGVPRRGPGSASASSSPSRYSFAPHRRSRSAIARSRSSRACSVCGTKFGCVPKRIAAAVRSG
jgi:hypothetical protein